MMILATAVVLFTLLFHYGKYKNYMHTCYIVCLLSVYTGEATKVKLVLLSPNRTLSNKTVEVCDGDTVFVECIVEKSAGLMWNIDSPRASFEAFANLPADFLDPNSPVNILVSSVSRDSNIQNSNLSSIAWFSVKEVLSNQSSLALNCTDRSKTKSDVLTVIKAGNNCTNK